VQALTDLDLSKLKIFCRGKVRTLYDLGENLLIVASDRISAFDHVLPSGIPDKGKILTGLSAFWFRRLGSLCGHHMITENADEFPAGLAEYTEILRDRAMLVRKARRIDVECVVRGYLTGSAWKEYSGQGTVAGLEMRGGLTMNARMEVPLFTPSTKSERGHDRSITLEEMRRLVGGETTERIRELSLRLYEEAARIAGREGLSLLDTKFEFGRLNGELILIDEILTPDSSRYLLQEAPGSGPINADKQFVRDYLEGTGWDLNFPPPALPPETIRECRRRYILLYERITGGPPKWVE
jgi:phosphoribosylaminoimidazole-succinocarboxamide synthase